MEVLQQPVINKLIIITIIIASIHCQLSENYEPVNKVCNGECICQNISDTLLLNCTNRGMQQVLNEWPPHKNNLIASFSGNNISELLQMPRSEAKSISLSFSRCGIKSLPTAMFIDATGIQFLDLSWNLLTGLEIRADIFRGRYSNKAMEPISLTQLDLSHNHIESIGYSSFEHTPHLQHLTLSYNPLRVLDPQTSHALSSVLSLQVLNLVNNSLKTMPTDVFSRLINLKEVDLSENLFERVPETLSYLSGSLEKLKIGGNLIQHLEDHDFMGLHVLKELNISGMNELRTIRHNTFAFVPKLRVLHCENNRKLFHIHEHAFGIDDHIPPLHELYLTNCDLQTLPSTLLHWNNLTLLQLSANRWHCDCSLFTTLSIINNSSPELISPLSSCSSPLTAAGTALEDLEALEKICLESLEDKSRRGGGRAFGLISRIMLVLSVVMLTMIACYVFWKVMIRYNTIRSINSMYPVMYVSVSPTADN